MDSECVRVQLDRDFTFRHNHHSHFAPVPKLTTKLLHLALERVIALHHRAEEPIPGGGSASDAPAVGEAPPAIAAGYHLPSSTRRSS